MTYVFRPAASDSADALATAIKAKRITAITGAAIQKGDVVLCWGAQCDNQGRTITVLNGVSLKRKFTDIQLLTKAGVRTVEATTTKPRQDDDPVVKQLLVLRDYIDQHVWRSRDEIVKHLPTVGKHLSKVKTELGKPYISAVEWLGREDDHSRGLDLITPPKKPDYWVKREEFKTEYRVHVFDGYSIRAGEKVKSSRKGTHHSWIKSWETGWDLDYLGVTQPIRDIAFKAVKALKLTFGAVDIGETAKGDLVVLEVNRAPALDGGEIPAYVRAYNRWMQS